MKIHGSFCHDRVLFVLNLSLMVHNLYIQICLLIFVLDNISKSSQLWQLINTNCQDNRFFQTLLVLLGYLDINTRTANNLDSSARYTTTSEVIDYYIECLNVLIIPWSTILRIWWRLIPLVQPALSLYCEEGLIHLRLRGFSGGTIEVRTHDTNLKTFVSTQTSQVPFGFEPYRPPSSVSASLSCFQENILNNSVFYHL